MRGIVSRAGPSSSLPPSLPVNQSVGGCQGRLISPGRSPALQLSLPPVSSAVIRIVVTEL